MTRYLRLLLSAEGDGGAGGGGSGEDKTGAAGNGEGTEATDKNVVETPKPNDYKILDMTKMSPEERQQVLEQQAYQNSLMGALNEGLRNATSRHKGFDRDKVYNYMDSNNLVINPNDIDGSIDMAYKLMSADEILAEHEGKKKSNKDQQRENASRSESNRRTGQSNFNPDKINWKGNPIDVIKSNKELYDEIAQLD